MTDKGKRFKTFRSEPCTPGFACSRRLTHLLTVKVSTSPRPTQLQKAGQDLELRLPKEQWAIKNMSWLLSIAIRSRSTPASHCSQHHNMLELGQGNGSDQTWDIQDVCSRLYGLMSALKDCYRLVATKIIRDLSDLWARSLSTEHSNRRPRSRIEQY